MLNRFLTVVLWTCAVLGALAPAAAETFFTPRELLAQHFRSSERVRFENVELTEAQRVRTERRLGRRLERYRYTVFLATTGDGIDGYALFDEERGQHEMISFATFFDAAGRVTRVEVVAYREPYGDGVRSSRFRRQFVGRDSRSAFRPGREIDVVSGATISSYSLSAGVERVTVLLDEIIRDPQWRQAVAQ